jgi:hypothetical protein
MRKSPATQILDPLSKVRSICLALPETYEKEAWGGPTFRVRKGKMFVMYVNNHHGDGILGIWCAAPLGAQAMLIDLDPDRFFKPPYVGVNGWVGVRLDRAVDWTEVASLIEDGYRSAVPKRGFSSPNESGKHAKLRRLNAKPK